MEDEVRPVDPAVAKLDRVGLAAVRALGLDASVHSERHTDPERVPGAVRVPPPIPREDAVRSGHGRERVQHPDRIRVGLEHKGMRLVEEPPARHHRARVAELACDRRATEPDEGRVRPIAESEQVRVDASSLYAAGPVEQPQ
jgi:hypothetical protein